MARIQESNGQEKSGGPPPKLPRAPETTLLQCPTQTSPPVFLLIKINYQLWTFAHGKYSQKKHRDITSAVLQQDQCALMVSRAVIRLTAHL